MIYSDSQVSALKDHLLVLIKNGKKLNVEECYLQSIDTEFDYDTCVSYYNQLCIRLWIINKHKLNNISFELVKLIHSGQSLVELANTNQISSYKLSKFVLESLHKFGYSKPITSITEFLENPNIIENNQLRKEILSGITNDLLCSHPNDQIKEMIGKQYERLLINYLNKYGIIYETENDLRNKGKPKTPDILLLIPMIVSFQLNNIINTNVINWIDSKAWFADEITYDEHKEQFDSYTIRYGRGLVIYWHGLSENIFHKINHDEILIIDHFPTDWKYPTGDIADGITIPSFLLNQDDSND